MRPRDLLLFVRKLVETAVNRGHTRIEAEDISSAERQYSDDMILNTAYEIADTDPRTADALYAAFQGARQWLSYADVVGLLLNAGIDDTEIDDSLDVLLWFGFLGVATDGTELYSHTVGFNIPRLRTLVSGGNSMFVIHPAFRAGLAVTA
jgi:hypothetical protein